jgi:hypothetical protein
MLILVEEGKDDPMDEEGEDELHASSNSIHAFHKLTLPAVNSFLIIG